jgi:hypothetical protein
MLLRLLKGGLGEVQRPLFGKFVSSVVNIILLELKVIVGISLDGWEM